MIDAATGYTVESILPEAKKILGSCSLEIIFSKITDAVNVLANTGEFDPLTGIVDLCVTDRLVTLPREVYTVLAVNIDGAPSLARDLLFEFHLNGPGQCTYTSDCAWRDYGWVPTHAPMQTPGKLVAFLQDENDEGAEIWAYGFDKNNLQIKSQDAHGNVVPGYQVPTVFGYALPDTEAPTFARVVRIRKAKTTSSVRLSSFDNDGTGIGTLIGIFDYDETEPSYRQIKLERDASWIRVAYRRRVYEVKSIYDVIPIPSRLPVTQMLNALKFYDEGDLARGAGFEANARRFLAEAIRASSPPTYQPIQVQETGLMFDKRDQVD